MSFRPVVDETDEEVKDLANTEEKEDKENNDGFHTPRTESRISVFSAINDSVNDDNNSGRGTVESDDLMYDEEYGDKVVADQETRDELSQKHKEILDLLTEEYKKQWNRFALEKQSATANIV